MAKGNNSKARAAILGRVRESLNGTAPLPHAREVPTPPATNLPADRRGDTSGRPLLKAFAAELSALSGVFHSCPRGEALALVLRLVAEAQATRVVAWPEDELPVGGLHDALRGEGISLCDASVPLEEPARTAHLAALEGAEVGITGAEAALADVGGIVVRSGGGRGRLASLLPPTHIALITPEQLYPSLYDWMEALRMEGRLEQTFAGVSNLTVIAGPSRTADIEKMLVLGVHGPKALHVILVEGE